MSKPKIYCGDKDEVPEGYSGRGSRSACLRRGVGVGMYIKEKQLREKYDIPIEEKSSRYDNESDDEKEKRFRDEEDKSVRGKQTYKEYFDRNFERAKRTSKSDDIGSIFKQLALLWTLEQKMKNENIYDDL